MLLCIDNDGFHLLAELSINGLKANAIIDTGASRSVLDINRVPHYLGDADLVHEDRMITGVGPKQLETKSVQIHTVGLGELFLWDVQAVVVDLTSINKAYAIFDLPRVDMVLGGDILTSLGAVIDYNSRQIHLSKSE